MSSSLTKLQYDVLNALVLKKMATLEAVEDATGGPEDDVASACGELVASELVVDLGGTYLPTDGAEPALVTAAADFYANLRDDDSVSDAADRFETINTAFLKAMSDWQQVPVADGAVANDHADPDYDGKVIDRIDKLVTRLGPVLQAFQKHDNRFARYVERFATALAKVDQGQTDFVSTPTVDSIHNVWFEFHEDLLRSLGRERVE